MLKTKIKRTKRQLVVVKDLEESMANHRLVKANLHVRLTVLENPPATAHYDKAADREWNYLTRKYEEVEAVLKTQDQVLKTKNELNKPVEDSVKTKRLKLQSQEERMDELKDSMGKNKALKQELDEQLDAQRAVLNNDLNCPRMALAAQGVERKWPVI